jgi:hypothetical protein
VDTALGEVLVGLALRVGLGLECPALGLESLEEKRVVRLRRQNRRVLLDKLVRLLKVA